MATALAAAAAPHAPCLLANQASQEILTPAGESLWRCSSQSILQSDHTIRSDDRFAANRPPIG